MGQDSWNLQYGNMHPARYRKGTQVNKFPDEGYDASKMVPGYAGSDRNWKGKVLDKKTLKANGNPRTFGPEKSRSAPKRAEELRRTKPLRKKNA